MHSRGARCVRLAVLDHIYRGSSSVRIDAALIGLRAGVTSCRYFRRSEALVIPRGDGEKRAPSVSLASASSGCTINRLRCTGVKCVRVLLPSTTKF